MIRVVRSILINILNRTGCVFYNKRLYDLAHMPLFNSHLHLDSEFLKLSEMKKYKNCQSCGMPMRKDPQDGGTNMDGSKSIMYCSYCYQEGTFTQPDFTVTDMKKFCKEKMQEQGFPSFIARLFTSGLPRLERWKNK